MTQRPHYLGRDPRPSVAPVDWWQVAEGEPFVLSPQEVQKQGLVEVLREGLAEGRVWPPPAPEPASRRLQLRGWHFELFEVDGQPHLALSNKPAVQAAADAQQRVPELQQAVVPVEQLEQALAQLDT